MNTSSYLKYLPAIFADDPALGDLLTAFETVLSGTGDAEAPGLEEQIDRIADYFDPTSVDEEFLPWLASWVALGLRDDWTRAQQREFLSRIVPLYRRRGTKANLAELLQIYTGLEPTIEEGGLGTLQVGVQSMVGVNTQLGGGVPHYFKIRVNLPADPADIDRQRTIITALVNNEKPAHTFYELEIISDTMQIGVRSTIGVDTILGTAPPPET